MSMSKHVTPVIGIDLGFTNLRMEAKVDTFGDEFNTPSLVSFIGGKTLIGDAAMRARLEVGTISGVNRLLGRQTFEPSVESDSKLQRRTFKVTSGKNAKAMIELDGCGKIFPELIAAYLLKEKKKLADEYFKDDITDVVITVPASSNDAQRRATRDAAMIAGFKHIRLLNKPSAAAIAYVYDSQDVSKNLLVFCLGGGSCEASVITVSESGNLEVKSTGGSNNLGSVEIDWALADWFIIGLRKKFPKFVPNEIDRERIRMACEAAKVKLSHEYEAKIVLDEPAFQCKVTRPLFQNLTKPIFAEITALIRKAVLDGGITIDQVLLVGASCRIAEVKTAMENAFPDYQPDFVRLSGQDRARGASLLADNIYDPDLLKDLSPFRLTCFIPYSATFKLSEDSSIDETWLTSTGETLSLKEANSPVPSPLPLVPAKYKDPRLQKLTTIFLQEESSKLAEPKRIGEIRIDRGLLARYPTTLRGHITYHIGTRIDRNGIMKVGFGFQARQPMRSEITVNILCSDGRMTQDEIRAARDDLARVL